MLTSPVSRVLTSAPGSRLFESQLCTCRGPVIDLSCTCRVPTPVTHGITTLRGAWSAGVDLGRESGARHRRRSSLSAGQDRGAGSGHLNHRGNPVTGPMCPQIKSPLLCLYFLLELVLNYASTCRELPFRPTVRIGARAADAGCCRRVPGHPSKHGANIGAHWSRPLC